MPMSTLDRERHLSSFASTPIQEAITQCRITIAPLTSVTSPSDIIGLPQHWTTEFASRLLSKESRSVGLFVGALNSSERASSSFAMANDGDNDAAAYAQMPPGGDHVEVDAKESRHWVSTKSLKAREPAK